MTIALTKLAEEDPTFRVSTNHETGQTIIAGMGELHLEIIVDRLLREFKVDANVGKPQVAYRETAGHDVEKAEGKFVRQSGGRGQYGHAVINMIRRKRASATSSSTRSSAASCPRSTSPSIDKGIQEALNTGVIAGFPVLRTSRSPCSTVLTTRSTPPRPPSRSPVPWLSRTPSRSPIRTARAGHGCRG